MRKARHKTRVHTGSGGNLTSQAVLIVSETDGEMHLKVHGGGDSRKVIDGIVEAMEGMMQQDPDFQFDPKSR